jgi:hypothetical protein
MAEYIEFNVRRNQTSIKLAFGDWANLGRVLDSVARLLKLWFSVNLRVEPAHSVLQNTS